MTGRSGWSWLAISIGLGFLSRPVTVVAFSIPVAVVVLRRIAKRNAWRELQVPLGLGFIFVALWMLWSQRTTGNPLVAPYGLYSRVYFPDDVMGFGLTGKHPLRALNSDMALFNEFVKITHKDYTLASLPTNLWERVVAIAANMWASRAMLLPLTALALITTSAPIWFALATTVLLVLAYLCFGHAPQWTVYYVEIQPVLASRVGGSLVADRESVRESKAPRGHCATCRRWCRVRWWRCSSVDCCSFRIPRAWWIPFGATRWKRWPTTATFAIC